MKKAVIFVSLGIALTAAAQLNMHKYGLKPEDQKYYKNDSMQGMNQLERIDSTVKEINKLHGEIAALKAEVATLKEDMEKLKK